LHRNITKISCTSNSCSFYNAFSFTSARLRSCLSLRPTDRSIGVLRPILHICVSHERGLPHKFFQGGRATSTFCRSNCQVADDVRSRNALVFLHDYIPKKMSHVTTTVMQKHFVGSHSQIHCSDFHKRLSAEFQSRVLHFTKALPWSGPAFSQLLPIGPRAERVPALRLPTHAQLHFLLKLRV